MWIRIWIHTVPKYRSNFDPDSDPKQWPRDPDLYALALARFKAFGYPATCSNVRTLALMSSGSSQSSPTREDRGLSRPAENKSSETVF